MSANLSWSRRSSTAVRQQFGRLDLLVSNAAVGVLRPALELSLKHWRRCMETNALALNLLAQQAVPLMPAGGRIIALSSLGAVARHPAIRLHRRLQGGPREPGPQPGAGTRPAGNPRQRGQRGGGGYRCAKVFPEPRAIAGRIRPPRPCRSDPHRGGGGRCGLLALPARSCYDYRPYPRG